MNPERDFLLRSRLFRLVVVALFLVLGLNLFLMMVPKHRFYKDQALENRQVRFRVRPPRGRITDRDGTLLADNMFIADIMLPAETLTPDGPDSTLRRLMTWFDLDEGETLSRLALQQERGQRRLVLVPNASASRIAAIEERERQLPGVRVESRPRRRYLLGPLFAHVIGYVGEVGQADLDTTGDVDGYRTGDMIGKQGVEAAFEEVLRGLAGVKLEEVNASGRIVGRKTVWLREVAAGHDVQLALSLPLQAAMAEAFAGQTACGVALDVRTGEVLAAYSNPNFDPNLMTVPITSQQWSRLVDDPAKPFFNRAVQATYPPGSLYKAVTSLAGLEEGVIRQESYLEPCTGGWVYGDRYFRCWKHSGHGPVDHLEAVVQSCDTYYYQLGLRLDIDQLASAARAFGLGRPCAGIFPEEAAGNIPDAAWYDRRFGAGDWTRGVLLNNAIGQGEVLVTPLQMALLAGRLATSGRMPDPVFVLDPPQTTVPPPPLPFAESDLAWVREALLQVVERGTGREARLPGIRVAGKTGTAQNPHGEDHAWFMCYAPAERPEVALAVIMENAGHGGSEAAPVARQWLAAYFADRLPAGAAPAAGGR